MSNKPIKKYRLDQQFRFPLKVTLYQSVTFTSAKVGCNRKPNILIDLNNPLMSLFIIL